MVDNIKIGKKYRIIPTPSDRQSSSNNNKGVIVTVGSISSRDGYRTYNVVNDNGLNKGWVYPYELEQLYIDTSVDSIIELIKENNESINELEEENSELKIKLNFMNDNNLKKVSNEEFETFQIMKELGFDDINKTKRVIKIIKGGIKN